MSPVRILFASCHSFIDPSNGAAMSARHLLELLAARGHACRALSGGVLDYTQETPLEAVLEPLGVPLRQSRARETGGTVFDLELDRVGVTLLATASSSGGRLPDAAESAALLALGEREFREFQPQVLLTFGGQPVNLELMARARGRGIAVVFFLRNLSYTVRETFASVSGAIVPSEFCRRHYAERFGLVCTALPGPVRFDRVVADDAEPQYVTFVNPTPSKGVAVFARIAAELGWRRPEIPLLVVESRGTAADLSAAGLDLSGLRNLSRLANTPDPRDIYRVSRAVLVPSVWEEPSGRVAAEGLANGLPVLASDRGGLPETLGDAGFVFTLPPRCVTDWREIPTPLEVAPWVATLERLWDDPAWAANVRTRAFAEAQRWHPEQLMPRYEEFFGRMIADARVTPLGGR